jgi:hypothetical protein
VAATANVPGLDVITGWARQLELPIDETVARAQRMMAADPTALSAGGEEHAALAGGLETNHQAMRAVGADVRQNWQSETATVFSAGHEPVLGQLGDTQRANAELADLLHRASATVAAGQHALALISGATAARLGMLTANPAPPADGSVGP